MKQISYQKTFAALMLTALPAFLVGQEFSFTTPQGEKIQLEIQQEDTFFGVIEQLISYCPPNEECQCQMGQGELLYQPDTYDILPIPNYSINLAIMDSSFKPTFNATRYMPSGVRQYHAELTEGEKNDIRKIILTLATVPVAGLIFYKGELEEAGNRIDKVHPLKFLQHVFTTEELRGNVGSIKPKGSWVWGEFIGNLGDSLSQESDYQNMQDAFIYDFAAKVKVDPNLIFPLIRQRQWEAFVETLIAKIPRSGNPKRYNSYYSSN